ncbi:AT-hook motif nuclear-localized protein 10-like [Vigna unguiculata]|uniref:AT-hook motif nuclear-localized protein 10-like n=1 Tax=Vigna unguiculata TaxID=3917 RepID=UPI001016966D|nr:AT-hook motif nuclear-localized protein 10-like [Vigna unguiculata]
MAERDKSKNKIPLAPDRMKKRGRPPLMLRGRGRGRPPSSSTVPPNIVSNVETGSSFVPYHLTVNPGEDLLEKVATFAKASSLTVCVLSAVGSISRVVFRKPCPPPIIDTVTWEGRFQILSLSGKYTFVPGQEGKYGEHNSWNLAISDFNGAVFGGSVVGPIIVASPVEKMIKLTLNLFGLLAYSCHFPAEECGRNQKARIFQT